MIEREVTDIVIATTSTFLLFLFELSSTDKSLKSIIQMLFMVIIFLNFLHIILRQLNRLPDKGSFILNLLNGFLIVISLVLVIIVKPNYVEGFWSFEIIATETSFYGIMLILYLILIVSFILSYNTKLLKD